MTAIWQDLLVVENNTKPLNIWYHLNSGSICHLMKQLPQHGPLGPGVVWCSSGACSNSSSPPLCEVLWKWSSLLPSPSTMLVYALLGIRWKRKPPPGRIKQVFKTFYVLSPAVSAVHLPGVYRCWAEPSLGHVRCRSQGGGDPSSIPSQLIPCRIHHSRGEGPEKKLLQLHDAPSFCGLGKQSSVGRSHRGGWASAASGFQ